MGYGDFYPRPDEVATGLAARRNRNARCALQCAIFFSDHVPMGPKEDAYHGLRDRALQVTAAELGLEPDAKAPIHGVIMETAYPEAVATFVCLRDGTVSLYFSTGGGFIGGGQHESVRAACLEMFEITNRYGPEFLAACQRVSAFALPKTGEVYFYLLAADGVHQAKCREDALAAQRDPFSAMFNNLHAVMAELRQVEKNR
jgi:hypothetical protein